MLFVKNWPLFIGKAEHKELRPRYSILTRLHWLLFVVPLVLLLPATNPLSLNVLSTAMPKENHRIAEFSSNQRRVCEFESFGSNELARNVSDDVLQYSPYPTPVAPASVEPSVLDRSERRQWQEPEGVPYLVNPPVSVENEGSSTLFQEVWIHASTYWV